ncbi:DUF2341 domain-containing protein [Thermococcus sp. GR6]|nr:DUF2341 domain-containing protein [Thermococcus sp. GR6]
MHFKMRKLRLTSAMLALVLLLATLGLAVPSINVSVQEIGVGAQKVVSPVLQGSIWFNTGLTSGELVFSNDLPGGTKIYVMLYDSGGNLLAYNYTIQLTTILSAGSVLRYSLNNPAGATRSQVSYAHVVVLSPEYETTLVSGNIHVNTQKLGLGVSDTTKFCTPITITENSGNTLYNYSVEIVIDDSATTNPELWKLDWNIVNGSSLYFTDDNDRPLYFWIQQLDTNNRIAVFWVNIPYLPANGKVVVCLNYGVWPNPYNKYQDLYKVFLFVDDFNTFNPDAWDSNSQVTVNNGILTLNGGQWVWTKQNFGEHYAVHMLAYLGYENGTQFKNAPNTAKRYYSLGPFIMGYISPSDVAYSEGIGGRYGGIFVQDAKGELTFTLPDDPDSNGYWDASISSPQYTWNQWTYLTVTLYNGNLVFYQKTSGWNWGNISTYIKMSSYTVTISGDGRIGIGQWSGGPSYYGWIVVRNYVDPEPSVSVGYWYYQLTFYPRT